VGTVGPVLRHPSLRPLALVATVAALAGTGCWSAADGPGADAGRSARVGETFVAQLASEIEGFPTTVVVPGRRYDLVVTSPRERMDSITAGEEGVRDEAAEGTAFVAVTWDLTAAGGDALVFAGQGPEASPRLSLVAGGETYEVGALDEEGVHARWVVVPEDTDDIGVAVEYDGVTQTVEDVSDRLAGDPVGAPELLYAEDPPGLHQPDCPEPAEGPEPARYVFSTCSVTITEPFPHHRDLGWADAGRAWVVARLRVTPITVGWDDPGQGGAVVDYETTPEEVEVTLDGAAPVELLPSGPEGGAGSDAPVGLDDEGDWLADVVFSVPADTTGYEVAFVRPYTGLPEDPDEAVAEGTPAELAGTYEGSFAVEVG
jgi:hypothetical protein